ncbi:MAG: hypothetical protein R6V01_09900 [Thermoplasmatota archaeon]
MEKIAAVVLAGNKKIRKELRRSKRKGFYFRLRNPRLWLSPREKLETSFASTINRDDYIVGENKSLLYLHPDLVSQKNLNFLKRVLYFAGKTGNRMFRNNKRDLLRFLSKEGITPLSLVIRALKGSKHVHRNRIVVVGPKKQIERELSFRGIRGVAVVEQGSSLGQNMLRGSKKLKSMGCSNDHILFMGGDVPLVTSSSIDDAIGWVERRNGAPDIFYGLGSREEVGDFISENGLESMGKVGPNYPRKGNLNKFGLPLVDDIPIFGKEDQRVHMMMGNLLLYRSKRISKGFIDRFYGLRKMLANPLTYPFLIIHFGGPLFKCLRWKMTLSEAEETFGEKTGVKIKACPVHPEVALDMDSYSDLRRLSALYFHRKGCASDLEMNFKEFVKGGGSRQKNTDLVGFGEGAG